MVQMQNMFRYLKPFMRGSRVWQMDRQTDGRTDGRTDRQTDRQNRR